jgi:hypothetical protein
VSRELSAVRLHLKALDLPAALEVVQRLLETEPGLGLLDLLEGHLSPELVRGDPRGLQIQLEDGLPLGDGGAGTLQDPYYPGVERARQDHLDLGNHDRRPR